jgi:hypothetical protein
MELEDITASIQFVNGQRITFKTNSVDLLKMQEALTAGKSYRLEDIQIQTFALETAPSWMQVQHIVIAMRNVMTIAVGRQD